MSSMMPFWSAALPVLPGLVLICSTPFLALRWSNQPICVRNGSQLYTTLLSNLCLLLIKVYSLNLWTRKHSSSFPDSIATEIVLLVETLCLGIILYVQYWHKVRPSTQISIYLAITILGQLLLSSPLPFSLKYAETNSLAKWILISKVLILFLHERSKWPILHENFKSETTEEATKGYWSRLTLNTAKVLFTSPNKDGPFDGNLLHDLDPKILTQSLFTQFEPVWIEFRHSWHGLLKTCARIHRWSLLKAAISRVFISALKFVYPALIYAVIDRASPQTLDNSFVDDKIHDAFRLVVLTLGIFLLSTLLKHYFTRKNYRVTSSIKGALAASVYKKLSLLNETEAQRNAKLSLISTDIEGALHGVEVFHLGWASSAEAIVCIGLLWHYLGVFTVLVVIYPIVSSFIYAKFAEPAATAQSLWNQAAQRRVSETTTMIQNIKGMKMTNKETIMEHLVERLREEELAASEGFFFRDAIRYSITISIKALIPMIAMASSIFRPQNLPKNVTAARLFSCLVLVILLSNAIHQLLQIPQEWDTVATGYLNIQEFLNLNTADDRRTIQQDKTEGAHSVVFTKASISAQAGDAVILSNINISLTEGTFTLVTGAAGAGKSVFLHSLLGQSIIVKGELSLNGTMIGYCGQGVWIQNTTIEENIVGSSKFDFDWYNRVIAACLLTSEIESLPGQHQYIVGRSGCKLNSSQNQRLAIARAVYCRSPILVLDDCLSAQDRNSTNSLLSQLFGVDGLVPPETTVVFATSLSFPRPELVDQVLHIGPGGQIVQKATSALEAATTMNDESVHSSVLPVLSQLEISTKEVVSKLQAKAWSRHGGERSTPFFFFNTTHWTSLTVWLTILLCASILEGFYAVYIRIWLENDSSNKMSYAICLLLTFLSGPCFALAYYLFYAIIAKQECRALHSKLLQAVLRTCFHFFDSEAIENITNLFDEAMCSVTRDLPFSMFQIVYTICNLCAQLGLVISLTPLTLIVIIPIPIILYGLQYLYLQPSKTLQQMNLDATSGVYSNFTETATGLAHVQALHMNEFLIRRNCALIDYSQKITNGIHSIETRLQLYMNLFITIMVASFVGIAIYGQISPYAIGLALFIFVELNSELDYFLLHSRNLEAFLTTLARIQAFLRIAPQEENNQNLLLPQDWPMTGMIHYENCSIHYSPPDGEPILREISLTIQNGEEAGIYGTAASGKSSFIYSLLNLIPYTGSIKIDGLEVRNIPRDQFRTRVTVIPQEPVIFPAMTVRQNLIPEEILMENVDENKLSIVIEYILDGVGLLNHVYMHGDTSTPLQDLKLSPGQLQRFSMAQALVAHFINRSKIVLIDGATSNVDKETRQCMQQVIREIFPDSTVITVAHHPAIVSDATVVGRITDGRIVMGLDQT